MSSERKDDGQMIRTIVSTRKEYAALILRTVLGAVFFAHGAQKAIGWFGGYGFGKTLTQFTTGMHIPEPLAVLAIAAEFLGGLGLILGLLTRIAATGIAVNMIVAIALVHYRMGFFMNWSGAKNGEGFEFHLLVLAIAFAVIIRGAGAVSVDRLLTPSPGDLAEGSD
jgi:putative oxidoreductase